MENAEKQDEAEKVHTQEKEKAHTEEEKMEMRAPQPQPAHRMRPCHKEP